MSWAQPTPDATAGAAPSQVLDLAVRPNARQRRWTAALRLLLAIPHLFLLFFLGLAAVVVVVIGWFGALFTGRLPGFATQYLSGYVRWQARVNAYLYFLTDSYPPFSFEPVPEYAVRLAVRPGRLNRWAVLFRIILVIPAYAVGSVVSNGASIVSIVSWAVTWITARLPEPFYEAYRVVLRFEARLWAYLFMLSSEYPWWGMFGDEAPPPATTVPPPGFYPGAWAPPAPSSYPPPPPAAPTPPSYPPPPPATRPQLPAATACGTYASSYPPPPPPPPSPAYEPTPTVPSPMPGLSGRSSLGRTARSGNAAAGRCLGFLRAVVAAHPPGRRPGAGDHHDRARRLCGGDQRSRQLVGGHQGRRHPGT